LRGCRKRKEDWRGLMKKERKREGGKERRGYFCRHDWVRSGIHTLRRLETLCIKMWDRKPEDRLNIAVFLPALTLFISVSATSIQLLFYTLVQLIT
jgi:hypothetical protein